MTKPLHEFAWRPLDEIKNMLSNAREVRMPLADDVTFMITAPFVPVTKKIARECINSWDEPHNGLCVQVCRFDDVAFCCKQGHQLH